MGPSHHLLGESPVLSRAKGRNGTKYRVSAAWPWTLDRSVWAAKSRMVIPRLKTRSVSSPASVTEETAGELGQRVAVERHLLPSSRTHGRLS